MNYDEFEGPATVAPRFQGLRAQAPSPSFTEGTYAVSELFDLTERCLSALAGDDDHGLLGHGFMVYDALFAWLRFAAEERHNWPAKAA